MGVLSVTLDSDTSHAIDHITLRTGLLTLSATYTNATGDSFTPGSFGFGILKDLWIQAGTFVWQVAPATLPLVRGSTGYVKVYGTGSGAQAAFSEIATNSNSGLTARFMAFGW